MLINNIKIICVFFIGLTKGSILAPRIIEHPIDAIVPRHEPATLNCKAEGTPKPLIQWYKDGIPIESSPNSHKIILPAGGLFFLKVVNSRRESDAGSYFCEARNELGVSRSHNATLQVAVLRDEFRVEPQNLRIAQGETTVMECAPPKGVPEPTVIWKKNGQRLDLDGTRRLRIVDGTNLAIQDSRPTDEGQYQCIAKNIVGIRESVIASLKISIKPFLIRGPNNQKVLEGNTVTFQCRVGGDPMPDVLWRRSGSDGNMPLDRVFILEDRSLRLDNISLTDEGEYSCEAVNAIGTISATGNLTVLSAPKFVVRPLPQNAEKNTSLSFECKASGNPKPTLFWSIEGNRSIILPGQKVGRFENFMSDDTKSSLLVLSKLDNLMDINDITVICSAINFVGSISARAQLSIIMEDNVPPPIIIKGPVNQTLPAKSISVMNCEATGTPKPILTWYKNGIPIRNSNHININHTQPGSLIISHLNQMDDQGLYTCVASSKYGKSARSGYLRVELPTNPNIKFFRAPDISVYPSAPGKPIATALTNHSVTLKWKASSINGGATIIGYSIDIFSNTISKEWVTVASKIPENIYTVNGLNFGANYFFVIRAENFYGFSLPSILSDVIKVVAKDDTKSEQSLTEARTLLTTENIVELLQAHAIDSTSIRLAWEILNGHQFIEGFYIYSLAANNSNYKMLTVLNGGGASACTMTGLAKATKYEFFLVPFYKIVEGKPSNSRLAATLEDVPSAPPASISAVLYNTSAVLLKWAPPSSISMNGVLLRYHIIVRGLDSLNISRILKNMTVDASMPSLLLANLTSGVSYSISIAAATAIGVGPFSETATLRVDPSTKQLDHSLTRFSLSRNISDDILTQTWFIILLGSIIAVIIFLFGAMILFKRYQFMKLSSLTAMHGKHAIGTIKRFPTLPLNANGVWVDPSGGIWRQASIVAKDSMSDYSQVSIPFPDYERLTPNMPDYAEVAGFSTFKIKQSPLYDSCGPYATTNLTTHSKILEKHYDLMQSTTTNIIEPELIQTNIFTGPSSSKYLFSTTNNLIIRNDTEPFASTQSNSTFKSIINAQKINVTENKIDLINNLNRTTSNTNYVKLPRQSKSNKFKSKTSVNQYKSKNRHHLKNNFSSYNEMDLHKTYTEEILHHQHQTDHLHQNQILSNNIDVDPELSLCNKSLPHKKLTEKNILKRQTKSLANYTDSADCDPNDKTSVDGFNKKAKEMIYLNSFAKSDFV